jgi:Kdo2-lipid IVA lauroyltransferase/acyltransferase
MVTKPLTDLFVYFVVRLLICIVQAMRVDTGVRLARGLAWLFAEVLRIRAGVVDDNLAHAFPHLSADSRRELARRMWDHLFLLVLEVAQTPRKIHETNWRDFVTLDHASDMVRLLLSDRPTLIITAHFGNFEVAGYVLGILGFPTHTVARTLDNPYLDRFVNRFRCGAGARIIPKNGGYDQIVEVLGRGEPMAFLADQYAGAKGCWIEFFGRPASAHKAIALLALEHDAPVAIAASRRLRQPMRFEIDTPAWIDPRQTSEDVATISDLTQWYTSRLEEAIRRAPDQYWWLHRRWKDTRKPGRRAKRAA